MRRAALWLLAVSMILSPAAASAREWATASGRKFQAELVEIRDDSVRLRLEDGTLLDARRTRLGRADQAFLREERARRNREQVKKQLEAAKAQREAEDKAILEAEQLRQKAREERIAKENEANRKAAEERERTLKGLREQWKANGLKAGTIMGAGYKQAPPATQAPPNPTPKSEPQAK